ncbi:hypothetical protein [Halosegnis longus]|uniref:hypothetical protein n=1 Tax=Halosegnis longus TaxID=2216012 RepID=UPI00096A9357|nr:hypothetical protein [Salella cibi]
MTEEVRMHVAQAYTRAVHPDAKQHLAAALQALNPDGAEPLVECDGCGRLMCVARLDAHDC